MSEPKVKACLFTQTPLMDREIVPRFCFEWNLNLKYVLALVENDCLIIDLRGGKTSYHQPQSKGFQILEFERLTTSGVLSHCQTSKTAPRQQVQRILLRFCDTVCLEINSRFLKIRVGENSLVDSAKFSVKC